jgi:hypothetical protein
VSTTEPDSIEAAREAAGRGELRAWVAEFLASPGSDNAPLGADLWDRYPSWLGPVRLPLDQLHRLAGPSDQPVLVEIDDEDWWRDDVEDLAKRIEAGWQPPPLVATWQDGQFVLEDGNHRAESFRRAGHEDVWTVVGFDDDAERDRFAEAHPTVRPASS